MLTGRIERTLSADPCKEEKSCSMVQMIGKAGPSSAWRSSEALVLPKSSGGKEAASSILIMERPTACGCVWPRTIDPSLSVATFDRSSALRPGIESNDEDVFRMVGSPVLSPSRCRCGSRFKARQIRLKDDFETIRCKLSYLQPARSGCNEQLPFATPIGPLKIV